MSGHSVHLSHLCVAVAGVTIALMRFSRLHASCVIVSIVLQAAAGFFVTGSSGIMASAIRYRSQGSASSASTGTSQRRGGDTLRMGAAGKKKKKLEKEALKAAGGITKTAAREAQREADIVVERLLKKCADSKRDLAAIAADISEAQSRTAGLKPAQSLDLNKDWRLVFASDDDALCAVGTGLHKLPLTRMQDFFMTLSGGSTTIRRIQAIEVLRVLGPFPNIRNTLSGDCKSTGPSSFNIRYTSMIDGTGKETGSSTGDQDRVVDVDVAFVGNGALILETKTEKTARVGHLVFAKEPDINAELAKLRVEGDVKDS